MDVTELRKKSSLTALTPLLFIVLLAGGGNRTRGKAVSPAWPLASARECV